MPRRTPRKPVPAPPIVRPVPSEPVVSTCQGISGKLLGLLKKFPMTISSPTKDHHLPPRSEDDSESDIQGQDDGEEEDEGQARCLDQSETDEDPDDVHTETSLAEVEAKAGLGDDQCQAIVENYLLETSTRTNMLRNRTQTQFTAALRRRLDFELSRITPSIAQVTALDYHQRDQGILRRTMEYVARAALEQKTYLIGMKRSQSQDEVAWDEMEKTHWKRKRALNKPGSTSSKGSSSTQVTNAADNPAMNEPVLIAPSTNSSKPPHRKVSNSKPPTHCPSQQSGSGEIDPKFSSTSVTLESKAARLPRRNESLISVNGSPVVSHQQVPQPVESDCAASDPIQVFANRHSGSSQHHHEFTFVKTSKWRELEDQLKRLHMDEKERRKLDEMILNLRMG